MAKDINIGGRLHSIATGNVIAGADEILDDNLGKKQTQINVETYNLVESINNALAELSPDQQEALGVATKANANEAKLGYYVCDTAAATAVKVIANATGYVLSAGGSIKIKMTNNNTADNATLNINSTGAKALYYAGERASANNSWEAGETVEVYYDGTNFYANNVAGGGGDGDGVFDVSRYNDTFYETLATALTAVPVEKRMAGMSIKFIQLTLATYTIKKTEGLEEAPAGTLITSAITNTNGTYKASQIVTANATDTASIQTTINAIASIGGTTVFYMAVTKTVDEQEVTTYTKWVITKITADNTEYVQYRYKLNVVDNSFIVASNWSKYGNLLAEKTDIEEVDIVLPLPKEYTRLNYIENIVGENGAYIQTRLVPIDDKWVFEGSYYVKNQGVNDQPVFGNYERYKRTYALRRYYNLTGIRASAFAQDAKLSNTSLGFIVDTLYKFKLYVENGLTTLELNGIKYTGTAESAGTLITNNAIQLFKTQYSDTSFIGAMGALKARHEGRLVFYAVPAMKTVEYNGELVNIYGMYEMVSREFLTSERTTQFVNSDIND